MKFKLSKYSIISDPSGEGAAAKRLVYSTRKGMGTICTEFLLQKIHAGEIGEIPDHMFNILMYHELLVPSEEDELQGVLRRKLAAAADTQDNEVHVYINSAGQLDESFYDLVSAELRRKANALTASFHQRLTLHMVTELADLSAVKQAIGSLVGFLGAWKKKYQLEIAWALKCRYSSDLCSSLFVLAGITPQELHLTFDLRDNILFVEETFNRLQTFLIAAAGADIKTVLYIDLQVDTVASLVANLERMHLLQSMPNTSIQYIAPEKDSLDESDELKLLGFLARYKLKTDLLPVPDHFYAAAGRSRHGLFSYTEAPGSAPGMPFINLRQTYYDDRIAEALLSNQIKCSTCTYLPMCGGRLDKRSLDDDDCPDFVRNFIEKAKLRSNIPLSPTPL